VKWIFAVSGLFLCDNLIINQIESTCSHTKMSKECSKESPPEHKWECCYV